MRILYIGDIFGEEAIAYLKRNLLQIKQDNRINIVFANGENVTNGRGISQNHYQELMRLGISCISMGNHTFSNRQIKDFIENSKIARPANYHSAIGKGYQLIKYNDKTIAVINLLGRVYMNNMSLDCPFQTLEKLLNEIIADYVIVDFHAEATSEKIALALAFDGRVSAVVGTHTHVPTADNRVLPNGTLFISDIGMTGPLNGVIGDNANTIIERFKTGVFEPSKVETGKQQFNAVILEINENNKNNITRINLTE